MRRESNETEKMEIIAIIPARGGSKGVPKKNIKPLLGKPLIAWTIEKAKKVNILIKLSFQQKMKRLRRYKRNTAPKSLYKTKRIGNR